MLIDSISMQCEAQKVYTLTRPNGKETQSILVDSPHSGRFIPETQYLLCPVDELPFYEDRYVDHLVHGIEESGITTLTAEFSRCFIDVNRPVDDLDETLIAGEWSLPFQPNPSGKSKRGYGLIRHLCNDGRHPFQEPLRNRDVIHRIHAYYEPYHQTLHSELRRLRDLHGSAFYINLHSMPSRSAPYLQTDLRFLTRRADMIIGDLDGSTCCAKKRNSLKHALEDQGFSVVINETYKGDELIRRHGEPTRGIHAVQLEINRAIYLNEKTYEVNSDFDDIKDRLHKSLTKYLTKI